MAVCVSCSHVHTDFSPKGRALRRIFVYGTLKRGHPNHPLLDKPAKGVARFLGSARLTSAYPLLIFTCYNLPFLLAAEGTGKVEFTLRTCLWLGKKVVGAVVTMWYV